MTQKLNRSKREYLRQLVLDTTLRRLTTLEALAYIKEKLHVSITDRYYYVIKKNIINSSGEQLEYLQKNRNAYLSTYFERIHELYKLQRELWELYYQAKADNDRKVQLDCIQHLKEVSVTLTEIYNLLPNMTGLQFESDNEKYNEPQYSTERNIAEYSTGYKFGGTDASHGTHGYSKDCSICEEGERKF
jgi:hypothetical protein